MSSGALAHQTTTAASAQQVTAVGQLMTSLNDKPGYRQGETSAPKANLVTFEVSSWLQVPQIIKALEKYGDDGIKLNFPKNSDRASSDKVAELREFFERFHSEPLSAMLERLQTEIDQSGELSWANEQLGASNRIESGAQWIAAFELCQLSIRDKLEVTNVVDIVSSENGVVAESLLVHARDVVEAGRQVIFQIDGSQGAASALFHKLQEMQSEQVHLQSFSIWSGSSVYYPKAEKPAPVEAIAVADFIKKEEQKAPVLTALHELTKHQSHGFELAKIKTWEIEHVDRNGRTVLDNLNRILKAEDLSSLTKHISPEDVSPELTHEWRASLLAAAIERLYHPGKANQDRHGTCGAESIIRLVGKVNVGEWARVVADLIIDGRSVLNDKVTLKPSQDWALNDISKSRDSFDALLQSAVMGHAAKRLGFIYHNEDDSFRTESGETQYQLDDTGNPVYERGDDGDIIYETDGSMRREKLNGMVDESAAELISAWLGETHKPLEKDDLQERFGHDYSTHIADIASKTGGIYIALAWGPGSHAVVLTGYDAAKDRFIFSNPHGADPERIDGVRIEGSASEPTRIIVDNEFGIQGMDRSIFEEVFQSAILPVS